MSALAVLCLLLQPILAVAHEQHDALHQLADLALQDAHAGHQEPRAVDKNVQPGSLESVLHAFDCCLHATVVSAPTVAPKAHLRVSPIPDRQQANPTLSPPSQVLRPPIPA